MYIYSKYQMHLKSIMEPATVWAWERSRWSDSGWCVGRYYSYFN